ncbi:MAG: exodeoxyribonuclease V subunit alpha [Spirochaetes bacterium]|nr:exodeoxyribonuclease V subunit alpha [Spirochaetota bacterium]
MNRVNYGIEQLEKLEAFSDMDRHVAFYLSSVDGYDSPLFFLMMMLLSRSIEKGNVCLFTERVAGRSLSWLSPEDPDNAGLYDSIMLPGVDEIVSCVKKSSAAGMEGDRLPVLISGKSLYFHRQMVCENELSAMVRSMCRNMDDLQPLDSLLPLFGKYFPRVAGETDMQAVAAAISLRRGLSVISGGPGTGKTSTVVRILSLITEARRLSGFDTRVALTAPTGKAAAKLALSANSGSDLISQAESFTIHRLLGYGRNSGFRHNRGNPLDFDVVIADECSMADLQLMHSFFSALKPGSRLILLGDRDQLASVEGGAVFGDICGTGAAWYSRDMAAWCAGLTGADLSSAGDKGPAIGDSLTFLSKNWRFGSESGIGRLAAAVNSGDSDGVMEILKSGRFADIEYVSSSGSAVVNAVIKSAAGRYIGAGDIAAQAVASLTGSFCILTATRKGNSGMERMNRAAEALLAQLGVIDPSALFYPGRPVMVTGNDYALQLFNGDIGIVEIEQGVEHAVFRLSDGTSRSIRCNRLPAHETAFAMTVHKSQGSEFDEVLLVLPDKWNPVMCRELLYTAVTRGKKRVTIAGTEDVIRKMTCTGLERMSGLRPKIHQPGI